MLYKFCFSVANKQVNVAGWLSSRIRQFLKITENVANKSVVGFVCC